VTKSICYRPIQAPSPATESTDDRSSSLDLLVANTANFKDMPSPFQAMMHNLGGLAKADSFLLT
jgi:hypothetical protein